MRILILKNRNQCPGMVVHAWNPSTQDDPCEREASLDYLASVRQAYTTQQDPASGWEREGKDRRKKTGWPDIFLFILCVWMFCMFLYMYPPYMHGNLGRLEEELELQVVESCPLDARNWTPVLQEQKVPWLLSHLSSPKQPWKLKSHRASHFIMCENRSNFSEKSRHPRICFFMFKTTSTKRNRVNFYS